MSSSNNKQLTEAERTNYREASSASLLFTSAGIIFLMVSDNWTIKLIAFAVVSLSAGYLLFKQKKFQQYSDFKTSLAFIFSSAGMVIVLWIMFLI